MNNSKPNSLESSTLKNDVLVSTIFKVHREMAIGRMTGVVEEDDITTPISPTNSETHYDIFDYEATNSKRSVECKCFICQRNIAAVRFAPHLEKCIGIGRNSRVSRRRTTYVDPPIKAVATRVSTRVSFNTNLTDSPLLADQFSGVFAEDSLIVEEEEEDDEEWNATSTPTKRRPKTRAVKKLAGVSKHQQSSVTKRS